MSKSKGKKAAGRRSARRPAKRAMSLTTAGSMIPLVSRVIVDIQGCWARIEELEIEKLDLDKRRRELDWPERSRRYQIADDITTEQAKLQAGVDELGQLSVALVDPASGEVGFPTIVNNRRAFFVWSFGDESLNSWRYSQEKGRRPIPESWRKGR